MKIHRFRKTIISNIQWEQVLSIILLSEQEHVSKNRKLRFFKNQRLILSHSFYLVQFHFEAQVSFIEYMLTYSAKGVLSWRLGMSLNRYSYRPVISRRPRGIHPHVYKGVGPPRAPNIRDINSMYSNSRKHNGFYSFFVKTSLKI